MVVHSGVYTQFLCLLRGLLHAAVTKKVVYQVVVYSSQGCYLRWCVQPTVLELL